MPSSRELNLDSPATHATSPVSPSQDPVIPIVDAKLRQLDQEMKTIDVDEQAAAIEALNKLLTRCESDLQTYMDEVVRLENALADSEKNRTFDSTTVPDTHDLILSSVREARTHSTELARERDSLNSENASLKNDPEEAKRGVTLVRRSMVEKKQSLENRLDEERRAKERARAQLNSRMEELQKRKSKFGFL
jgi:hypothetical protein